MKSNDLTRLVSVFQLDGGTIMVCGFAFRKSIDLT